VQKLLLSTKKHVKFLCVFGKSFTPCCCQCIWIASSWGRGHCARATRPQWLQSSSCISGRKGSHIVSTTRRTRDSWSRPQGSMTRTFCCYGDTYYIISTTILRFSSTCAKITGVHRKVCKVLVCSGQVVHSPLLSVHLMPAAEAEDVVPVRRVFSDDRAVSAYHGRGVLVVWARRAEL